MASVWYVGPFDKRDILGRTFDISNGWSLPESVFTGPELAIIDSDPWFLLGQPDGPRTDPAPPITSPVAADPGYLYYSEVKRMYDYFVANGGGGGGSGAVSSVAGRTGAVILSAADISDTTPNTRSLLVAADYAAVKTLLSLGNVSNTSDANKPVSTAQQTALNLKANAASPAFTGTPTGLVKAHVGLGNVDNTADSAKPISTAQQAALNAKAPLQRVTKQDVNSTGVDQYFKLATFPIDDSANFASLLLRGRLGGWTTENSAYWEILIGNRTNDYSGIKIKAAVNAAGSVNQAIGPCDLAAYAQVDKSAILYIRVPAGQYYSFDLEYDAIQSVPAFTGIPEAPVGTDIWHLWSAPRLGSNGVKTLYGTDSQSLQTAHSFDDVATAWTMAQRRESGQLAVGAPTQPSDAVRKTDLDAISGSEIDYAESTFAETLGAVATDVPGLAVTFATTDSPAMVEFYPAGFLGNNAGTITYQIVRVSDGAVLAMGVANAISTTVGYDFPASISKRIPAGTASDTYKAQAWRSAGSATCTINPAAKTMYLQAKAL